MLTPETVVLVGLFAIKWNVYIELTAEPTLSFTSWVDTSPAAWLRFTHIRGCAVLWV